MARPFSFMSAFLVSRCGGSPSAGLFLQVHVLYFFYGMSQEARAEALKFLRRIGREELQCGRCICSGLTPAGIRAVDKLCDDVRGRMSRVDDSHVIGRRSAQY